MADLAAASASAGENRVGVIHVQANAPDLRWSRRAATALGDHPGQGDLQGLSAGDLHVQQASARFEDPWRSAPARHPSP
jgi:hypothetical protein